MRIADVRSELRNERLQNKRAERYLYTNLLGYTFPFLLQVMYEYQREAAI
jgi:hypothetical protein